MRIIPILIMLAFLSCETKLSKTVSTPPVGVENTLDNWHQAAAEGEYDTYFDYFEDSLSIFIGTDATERWTIEEFAPWAKPAFEDGMAWNFTPFNRHVYYAEDKSMAWFDEELNTPNLGLCRGTGVLKVVGNQWKIVHYNLAIPVPNDIVYSVRDQILALDSASQ